MIVNRWNRANVFGLQVRLSRTSGRNQICVWHLTNQNIVAFLAEVLSFKICRSFRPGPIVRQESVGQTIRLELGKSPSPFASHNVNAGPERVAYAACAEPPATGSPCKRNWPSMFYTEGYEASPSRSRGSRHRGFFQRLHMGPDRLSS